MTTPIPDPPPDPSAGPVDFDPFRYGRPEPGSPAAAAFPHLFEPSRPAPPPYPPPGAAPSYPGDPPPFYPGGPPPFYPGGPPPTGSDVSPYAAASGRSTGSGPGSSPGYGATPPPYDNPGAPPSGYSSLPPYGSPPYGSPPYGSPPYGSPPYGSPPYGSPPYGSPPYGYPGTAAWSAQHGPGAGRAANGRAVAGFVLGLVAALCFWLTVLDLPFIVLGIVFSILGLRVARQGGPHGGLAIAGIALAVVGALAATIFTVVVVVRINSCTDSYGRDTAGYIECVRFQRSP
ncbi:MAG: hypothetical protein ABJA87_05620 [bacterium]